MRSAKDPIASLSLPAPALALLALGCATSQPRATTADLNRTIDALRSQNAASTKQIEELQNRVFILQDRLDSSKVASEQQAQPKFPVVTLHPPEAGPRINTLEYPADTDVEYVGDAATTTTTVKSRPVLKLTGDETPVFDGTATEPGHRVTIRTVSGGKRKVAVAGELGGDDSTVVDVAPAPKGEGLPPAAVAAAAPSKAPSKHTVRPPASAASSRHKTVVAVASPSRDHPATPEPKTTTEPASIPKSAPAPVSKPAVESATATKVASAPPLKAESAALKPSAPSATPTKAAVVPPPKAEPATAKAAAESPPATKVAVLAEPKHEGPATARPPVAAAPEAGPADSATADAPAPEPLRLYRQGIDLLKAHRHAEAVATFRDFVAKYPKHDYADNAQYWLGECFYDLKDHRAAVREFKEVVEKFPAGNKVPDALLKAAYSYLALGESAAGREALAQVIKAFPKHTASSLAAARLRDLDKPTTTAATPAHPPTSPTTAGASL